METKNNVSCFFPFKWKTQYKVSLKSASVDMFSYKEGIQTCLIVLVFGWPVYIVYCCVCEHCGHVIFVYVLYTIVWNCKLMPLQISDHKRIQWNLLDPLICHISKSCVFLRMHWIVRTQNNRETCFQYKICHTSIHCTKTVCILCMDEAIIAEPAQDHKFLLHRPLLFLLHIHWMSVSS